MRDDPYDLRNSSSRSVTYTFTSDPNSLDTGFYTLIQEKVYNQLGYYPTIESIQSVSLSNPVETDRRSVGVSRNYQTMRMNVQHSGGSSTDILIDLHNELKWILFSADSDLRLFKLETSGSYYYLTLARYGHGVGMSQRGAQQMAAEGKTYREILAYYYGGAALSGYAYTLPENIPADPETPGPATPAPATAAAFVKGSDVNLRKSASSSSASLARLRDRTALTVSGLSGAWYAVRVDATGQTGYIHSDYVTLSSDTPLANGFVNASAVNIRRGNSTRTESLGRLDRNTKLTIYGMVKGWCMAT